MKVQLHRVGLDGKNDKRLTDPAFAHTVNVSPGREVLRRRRADARQAAGDADSWTLTARSSPSWLAPTARPPSGPGFAKVEMFTFLAGDGKTRLHGEIAYPSNFDPAKKYPALLAVYGGPNFAGNTPTERFSVRP